jgi:hypothetical protein
MDTTPCFVFFLFFFFFFFFFRIHHPTTLVPRSFAISLDILRPHDVGLDPLPWFGFWPAEAVPGLSPTPDLGHLVPTPIDIDLPFGTFILRCTSFNDRLFCPRAAAVILRGQGHLEAVGSLLRHGTILWRSINGVMARWAVSGCSLLLSGLVSVYGAGDGRAGFGLVHPQGRGKYVIVSSQENTVVPESSQCLA